MCHITSKKEQFYCAKCRVSFRGNPFTAKTCYNEYSKLLYENSSFELIQFEMKPNKYTKKYAELAEKIRVHRVLVTKGYLQRKIAYKGLKKLIM